MLEGPICKTFLKTGIFCKSFRSGDTFYIEMNLHISTTGGVTGTEGKKGWFLIGRDGDRTYPIACKREA